MLPLHGEGQVDRVLGQPGPPHHPQLSVDGLITLGPLKPW